MEEFFFVSEVLLSLSVLVSVLSVLVPVGGVVGDGVVGITVAGRFMVGMLTLFCDGVADAPELVLG